MNHAEKDCIFSKRNNTKKRVIDSVTKYMHLDTHKVKVILGQGQTRHKKVIVVCFITDITPLHRWKV